VELCLTMCNADDDCGDEESKECCGDKEEPLLAGDNKVLRFVVMDYGKGIDKKEFENIFHPFTQTTTSINNTDGGTGLGLAITKELVEALGGTIAVDSELGKWTKFTVEFPLTGPPADIASLSARLQNTNILFVSQREKETTYKMIDVFDRFRVNHVHFPSMKELYHWISSEAPTRDSKYVCLVHGDLYEKETFDLLSSKAKSVLITFGTNNVEEAAGHYRSLVDEKFPSILMREIADQVKASSERPEAPTRIPSKKTVTVMVPSSSSLNDLKVLIAEDNLVNQKVLRRLLNRIGVDNIIVVDNGQKAVEREAVEPFDVIFMDMQMPVMDGLEACKLIVNRPESHPKPKIIFVSAHVSETYRSMCMESGAVGYLPKPCTVNGLKAILEDTALL
jgi:CheY-like chemotaxis protein